MPKEHLSLIARQCKLFNTSITLLISIPHSTTMNSLQDRRIKFTAGDWPTFLYDEQEYDPKEKDKGLLHGYMLVLVSTLILSFIYTNISFLKTDKHIFTSPASSLSMNVCKGMKPSKSKLHGLHHVTARTIAYAAVQVNFCSH